MEWFVTWLTTSDVTAYLVAAADVVSKSSMRYTLDATITADWVVDLINSHNSTNQASRTTPLFEAIRTIATLLFSTVKI